jgi:ferredoxin
MAIILKKEKLPALVAGIKTSGNRFVAPTLKAKSVKYAVVEDASQMTFDYVVPVNPAKEFFFPQTETIAEFDINRTTVDLRATEVDARPTVIFGTRPCDADSFASLRSVFTWDFIDESYTKREESAVIISIACSTGDDACFCTSVGLTPDSTAGSDILLREMETGDFAVEAVTARGKDFVKAHDKVFSEGTAGKLKEIFKPVKVEADLSKIDANLKERAHYENPIWPELARKCIGCGACTFSCPTCHCFDITDEGSAFKGKRKKNWDACQFENFTLHAGGHNPRDTQPKRWRNRFMCKFNIYPNKFKTKGCVGCGRCVRVCPVRLDITEAMAAISAQKVEKA